MAQLLQNTMSCRYFSTQLEALNRRGYLMDSALPILDITQAQLGQGGRRLPIQKVEAVYEDAARALDDPLIAMRIGHEFRVPNYAQTGALYGLCPNLSYVLDMNSKYQKLAVDAAHVSHDIEDGRHFLSLTPYDHSPPATHILLMIMGAYASTFQWLTWTTKKEIKAAYFLIPAPKDVSVFEDIFRCPLHFGQEKMRLEYFNETIDMPLSTANAEKLAAVIAKLDALLESQNTAESFTQAVQNATRVALRLGTVSLPIVAKRLDLSERQLREKLKSIDQTYSGILKRERKAAFQRLYKEGESFAAIAQSLGYNDQSAFNRAFKRWYGMPPGVYSRKLAKNAAAGDAPSTYVF